MTIYRGPGGTGEARTDTDITEVREIMIEAKGYRDEAQIAAAAAVTDADEAEASADAAAVSAAAALASQTSAASSASTATAQATIATNAANSATASQTAAAASAVAADASADAAANSETNAAVSAGNASDSEIAADASADAAATSAAASASSASAALASQNAAASSASSASGSASAASASQTAAAASAAAAAASFDSFDDRYLGAKATDPSVDNDGNALLDGALYWNTVADEFRAWNGSGWESLTGLPSVSGQAGKFLFTNGSVASWATVPDPQPATPTNDGLVYGVTEANALVVRGDWAAYSTQSISTGVASVGGKTQYTFGALNPTDGGLFTTWINANVKVGDDCFITESGNTQYFGVVSEVFTEPGGARNFKTLADTPAAWAPLSPNGSTLFTYSFSSPRIVEDANVSLGYGSNNNNGGANTAIGYGAGSTITTGSNLTVIGHDAEPSSATATNEVTLGNSSVTKTRVWGALAINDQTGTSGQVLTSNGTSTPTWQTPATAPVTSVNTKTGAVVLTASDVGAATASQGTNADTAFGWGNHALAGYAADSAVVKLTGDQTVAGTKTFSSTISGNISGNAGTVTNGVYTTGSYSDPTWITSLAGSKITGNISGNAGTVTNGVYTTGDQTIAGTKTFSNPVTVSAGTAAAPAITTTGDTNTGIFFPAADTIAFAEGGAEVARFDASGNLGVGTSSPSHRLHVNGNAFVPLTNSYFCFNSDFGMGTPDSDALQIFAGSGNSIRFGNRVSGTFTERMRLDASGNLALGSTSILGSTNRASFTNNVTAKGVLALSNTSASGYSAIELYDNGGGQQGAIGWGNASVAVTGAQSATYLYSAGAITFLSGGATERARIDSSGNLLVGTTSMGNTHAYFEVSTVDRRILNLGSSTTSSAGVLQFRNPNGVVGVVATSGSSTSYLTSSDYRLKENIQPMTSALAKVAALKPCTYKWKVDGSDGQGFIAHELAEVEPGCVTGEKDAVDADGNPQYQGIDTSFLVATLTAAIQEQQMLIEDQRAIITAQAAALESLTARVAALESSEGN